MTGGSVHFGGLVRSRPSVVRMRMPDFGRPYAPPRGAKVIGHDVYDQPIYEIRGRADQLWITTTGAAALVAATLKVPIEMATGAAISNSWVGFDISFDGVTSTAIPVKVDLMTYSASGTGTAITYAAAHRANVSVQYSPVSTAKVNVTTEGATPTVVCSWYVHPQAGITYQFPLGREFGMGPSMFKAIRATAPAAVNYLANLWHSE